MPQENLNKIWNAGKYFEPESEENPKPTSDETKPSNVKRRINVAKAFVPQQEDPFRQKVEAVLKGIEPAFASAMAGEEEKPVPADTEVIDGRKENHIGEGLVTGKSILVKGSAGDCTGIGMSGGEIYVKGDAEKWTGCYMSGGTLRIDGDVASFGQTVFFPGNKGTIIWKEETIWENGQKVEPGWTNLKVEEKIAE